jgi:hypothetical protein
MDPGLLERADDQAGYPAAVESARLWDDLLAVNGAAVNVREYRGPLPFWSYFPEMCWRGRRIGSTKSKAPRRELTALYRYTLTGELNGDDEIRGFYEDDITNLEVEDRQAITVENWLGKTCSTCRLRTGERGRAMIEMSDRPA